MRRYCGKQITLVILRLSHFEKLLAVMAKHSIHDDLAIVGNDFVDQSVLDVDSPRKQPIQIANKFFKGWRQIKGIAFKLIEHGVNLSGQSCLPNLNRVFSCSLF
jgi:hypothetical protein